MAEDPSAKPDLDLDDDVPEEITWPKTVGITSIVWASIGLGCVGCAGVGVAMQNSGGGVPPGWGPMPDVMKQPPAAWAMMAVGVLLAAFLMASGIALLRRSLSARTMHLIYAVAGLINTGVSTVLQFQHQLRILAWAKDHPDDNWAKMMSGGPWMLIGAVVGLVMGAAWPLFCLVWFGMVKRTHESMGAKASA